MQKLSAAAGLLVLIGLVLSVTPASVAEEQGWGTVKGQVVFDAPKAPAPEQLKIDKDQNHCLSKGPLLNQKWVVNPANKGVRWAFVWLAPASMGEALPVHPSLKEPKNKEVVIDQPCCQFEPHALGLRAGQVLVVKNSAPIPHNVNWQGGLKNPGNNVIIPPGGEKKIDDLQPSHLPVNVACNIHGWMQGWVRIYDHPYFAVTDADGKFEFKNAPAGNYHLVSWHESVGWGPGGRNGSPITIKAGGTTEVPVIGIKPTE